MLLWLAEYLAQFHNGFLVVQYITLRGILSVLTALFIAFWVGPIMIRKLREKQVGQAIRDDGPKSHLSKAGTPTMGGALILVAIVISTLLWADLSNRFVWITLGVLVIFGAVAGSMTGARWWKRTRAVCPPGGSICGYQWVRWGRRLRCSLRPKAWWKPS